VRLLRTSAGGCRLAVAAVLASTVVGAGPAAARPPEPDRMIVVESPNVGRGDNQLTGVTAFSPERAVAVGAYRDENNRWRTLIETWDGTDWTVTPSPNASEGHSLLNAVAGATPDDIWAFGSAVRAPNLRTSLVERFDGRSWRVVKLAIPGVSGGNELFGAIAFGSANVWAVGYHEPNGGPGALIVHWDGTQWIKVPAPGKSGSRLHSIAASAPDNAWAVGSNGPQPLILRWRGGEWRPTGVSIPGADAAALRSVTAVSDTEAYAAGSVRSGTVTRPLLLRWNGIVWSELATPYAARADYTGVSAADANDLWVIGYRWEPPPNERNTRVVALHWNGTTWHGCSQAQRPRSDVVTATATGAAALKTPGEVLAVGRQHALQRPGAQSTLVVRGELDESETCP